jgi:hypothetical protein
LLVPEGNWQTERDSPVSSANFCSSNFQSRSRDPLLPPPNPSDIEPALDQTCGLPGGRSGKGS